MQKYWLIMQYCIRTIYIKYILGFSESKLKLIHLYMTIMNVHYDSELFCLYFKREKDALKVETLNGE